MFEFDKQFWPFWCSKEWSNFCIFGMLIKIHKLIKINSRSRHKLSKLHRNYWTFSQKILLIQLKGYFFPMDLLWTKHQILHNFFLTNNYQLLRHEQTCSYIFHSFEYSTLQNNLLMCKHCQYKQILHLILFFSKTLLESIARNNVLILMIYFAT